MSTNPKCSIEGCPHPSIVSVHEHEETGLPLLCAKHFYEGELEDRNEEENGDA